MSKTILLIHGRGFHPSETATRDLWLAALRHGVERDFPQHLPAFDAARKKLVYFGDVSGEFLRKTPSGESPLTADDLTQTLSGLQQFKTAQFTRKTYRKLPGRNPWKRELADTFAGALYHLGLSEQVISSVLPDMAHYWNSDSAFGSDVRFPAIGPLRKAMQRGDQVMIISHSLGSMIAYDTLWKFSHLGEYRPDCCHKTVDRWITLGSPLADPTVRANLKGARADGPRRYPHNVNEWINISARDDYIAYRPRVARGFKEMLSHKLVQSITDVPIENLAVSRGQSDPHHALGYLIHPQTAKAVADWLATPETTTSSRPKLAGAYRGAAAKVVGRLRRREAAAPVA